MSVDPEFASRIPVTEPSPSAAAEGVQPSEDPGPVLRFRRVASETLILAGSVQEGFATRHPSRVGPTVTILAALPRLLTAYREALRPLDSLVTDVRGVSGYRVRDTQYYTAA